MKFPYFLEREQIHWISFTDTDVLSHGKYHANVVKCLYKLFSDHAIMSALQKSDPKYYLSARQEKRFLLWDWNISPPKNTQLSIRVELTQLPLTKSEWTAGE